MGENESKSKKKFTISRGLLYTLAFILPFAFFGLLWSIYYLVIEYLHYGIGLIITIIVFVLAGGLILGVIQGTQIDRIERVPALASLGLVSSLSISAISIFSSVTIGAWISYSLFSLGIGTPAAQSIDPTYGNLISTYLWHLVNVIPFSNVEMSIGMKEPVVQFVGWVSGIPFLAFRLFVVVIIFGAIRDSWKVFKKNVQLIRGRNS
jgi:hypothetical protein